jgi:hypothetical protein
MIVVFYHVVQKNMNKFQSYELISGIPFLIYIYVEKEMLINYLFLYITGPTSFSNIIGILMLARFIKPKFREMIMSSLF